MSHFPPRSQIPGNQAARDPFIALDSRRAGAGRARPDSVAFLAVLAIVFGGLGSMCTGLGTVVALAQLRGVAVFSGPAGQVQITHALKEFGVLDSVLELALYVALLMIGIGALWLKRWARQAAASWWSLVMIAWAVVRMVLKLAWIGPASLEAIKQMQQSTPGAMSMPTNITLSMIGGALFTFAVQLLLPVLFLARWRRPAVVEAFEGNVPPGDVR